MEEQICDMCAGTGEGPSDYAGCPYCRGSGFTKYRDPDDYEEPEDDD